LSGKNVAIILAGGSGVRFGAEKPKQLVKLAGKTVIEHTIEKFEKHPMIDKIYLVVNPSYRDYIEELIKGKFSKVKKVLNGGKTRQESSSIGIMACEDEDENVLVHDAVRPFVSAEIISEMVEQLKTHVAVDVAIPSPDTIIQINDEHYIVDIPQRKYMWRGQTPQGFKKDILLKAHKLAIENGIENASDDCSLVLKLNLGDIFVISGSKFNIKITYPLDIHIADKIFQIYQIKIPEVSSDELKKYFRDKVVVVFGGTSGIGLEICNLTKSYGSRVYSLSRRVGVDIRNYDSVKKALDEIYEKEKRIDVVVVSSGVLKRAFIESADIETIREQIETNLMGNILVAKASIPYLKESHGSITFFASSSYTRGRMGYTPYSSSKAALVNFVQGFSDEVSEYGICANVVSPERTATPMRVMNFGKEDPNKLLSPEFVALATLKTIASRVTGSVISVTVADEKGS